MSTQRILFAVLTAVLYLSIAAFGDDTTEETPSSPDLVQPEYGELVPVFPDQPITIYSGNSMTLRMLDQYENLTSCTVTLPNGEQFDTLNETFENISSVDQCGVLVYGVSDEHTGTWRLDGKNEENITYYGTFSVEVLTLNSTSVESTVLHVKRGTSVPVMVGPDAATSCRFTNALGEYLPVVMGNCQTDIASVNEAHEGVWTASYSLTGKMTLIEEQFEIVIYDEILLNTTVTTSNDGQIHLLCRVRAASASLCQFITPSQTVLDMVDGVGNDGYAHFGNGLNLTSLNDSQDHECGITILKPGYGDYGTWKCIVGTDSGLTGSVLQVSTRGHNSHSSNLEPEKYNVYVTKGNSFELKCSVNAALRYCLMHSPSGKVYTVSTNGNSSTALPYTGMGLPLGECGAVIQASEEAHEGNWYCTVGLSDERELRTRIEVVVTDTILVPIDRTVTLNRRQTKLSCSIPREFGHSVDYCMWIGPDGALVGSRETRRYSLQKTSRSCFMTIKNINESEDIGEWTCMATLVGSSENVWASIEVLPAVTEDSSQDEKTSQRNSTTFYFFMLVAFSISTLCLVVLLAVLFRAKWLSMRQPSDSPPKYSESMHTTTTPPYNRDHVTEHQ